jgi:hypothetical protein
MITHPPAYLIPSSPSFPHSSLEQGLAGWAGRVEAPADSTPPSWGFHRRKDQGSYCFVGYVFLNLTLMVLGLL